MNTGTRNIEDLIAMQLRDAGFDVTREVDVRGLRVDFVVTRPDGGRAIIDVKESAAPAQALRIAEQMRKVLGSRGVFVVGDFRASDRAKGVVRVDELVGVLRAKSAVRPVVKMKAVRKRGVRQPRRPKSTLVFAAMPFDQKFDDTFYLGMVPAAEAMELACKRVDKTEFIGDIPTKIRSLIKASAVVIADVSGAKPNVLYEAGFAHALRKPTIHISSTPLEELPFDISHDNTIPYSLGQVHKLQGALEARLHAVLHGEE